MWYSPVDMFLNEKPGHYFFHLSFSIFTRMASWNWLHKCPSVGPSDHNSEDIPLDDEDDSEEVAEEDVQSEVEKMWSFMVTYSSQLNYGGINIVGE